VSTPRPGTLFLVPTPLDFGCEPADAPLTLWLSEHTLVRAAGLRHWISENAKSTRAFLKRVQATHPLCAPLQDMQIQELPRAAHKKGDHMPDAATDAAARALLQPALQGHPMGLVSEAGMPAVADPGSAVVRAAHTLGVRVVPLVGPNALLLALAASGLNGQHFAFVGYLPQDAAARAQAIRALEQSSQRSGQTQLMIETPYRNAALLQALLQHLQPQTRLCVASALSLPQESVRTDTIQGWRAGGSPAPKGPCIFLFGV
jgi:16S rRNA (cytidine1402-2'-O)-methyltransferase